MGPYHNRHHGFSITQFLFTMYTKVASCSQVLAPMMGNALCLTELLGMFVAVLVHDADHPGNNNAWEVGA